MTEQVVYSVQDFQAVCNQIMETAFSGVIVEGEVASFKENQGKYIFFDLKEGDASVGCFMMKFALRFPVKDGMKVRVRAVPKLTKWGKFSLTVQAIVPVGEGDIKKSFELLKKKLTAEGLFASEKKRSIPANLTKIGVISSTQAAGYADFCKILNERWGGLKVLVAHTQVQGMVAADQIIKALNYFNERGEVQIIAIIRGGGSADDLAVFNDEALVRAVAASKIPVITGIGHEIDTSLCDLAADIVASTPSNVAQMLTRDKKEIINAVRNDIIRTQKLFNLRIDEKIRRNREELTQIEQNIVVKITTELTQIQSIMQRLTEMDPEKVLKRGYAILAGEIKQGSVVKITTETQNLEAEIKKIEERNDG